MSRAAAALVFAVGVVLMLAASPAPAFYNCPNVCNCNVACTQTCGTTGPPDFELYTCGDDYGVCIGMGGCDSIPDCPAVSCTNTINGTSGGDTLNGGTTHDCINGLGGADTISGDAGDDTIHGGDANDTMYGGSGNDCIYGDAGGDNATGDSGTDLCDAETEASCEI
jgi:Ca2+-binding RTX toxin-like protein